MLLPFGVWEAGDSGYVKPVIEQLFHLGQALI